MKILKDDSKKLIIDMVIVKPLRSNTFERELKALTEDYVKKVMTMATLWRINNFVPAFPEKIKPKSTKTVDSQKILRDLRLKALTASYITAGNPLERQKALSYYFKAKKRIGPKLGHQFERLIKTKNIEIVTSNNSQMKNEILKNKIIDEAKNFFNNKKEQHEKLDNHLPFEDNLNTIIEPNDSNFQTLNQSQPEDIATSKVVQFILNKYPEPDANTIHKKKLALAEFYSKDFSVNFLDIRTYEKTKNLNVEWQVILWGGESKSITTTIAEDGTAKTKTKTKKISGVWKTKDEEDLQKIEDNLKSKKCRAISDIFEAGSDFLQNFFEICFQFHNDKGEVINSNNTILPDTLLYTRTSSISIPRLKPKTFTLKTAKSSVEKIASQLPGSYEITINVRADEECKILTNFLKSSGIYEFDKDYIYNFPASAIFNDNMNTRMDIVIETISGLEHNPSLRGNTHLISVTPNEFGKYYKEILDSGKHKSMVNTPNVNLNFSEKLEWILTDARLVNISDVSFGVGNSSPVELQLQFIIKDIYLREGPMSSLKKN